MRSLPELPGKRLALLLTDENGECVVCSGIVRKEGETLLLERSPEAPFEIRREWQERVEETPNDEVRKILLGADYLLRLSVGPPPEETSAGEYEPTGLKWP